MNTKQDGRKQPKKKSLDFVCVILSSQMFKVELSQFLLLTVKVSSQGLVSVLNSIVLLQGLHQGLRVLFRVHSGRFLSYQKQRKISQNGNSLSLVVIRCTTRYHSLYIVILCFSLSLVVLLVATRCHSSSFDVPLFCLFINDQRIQCREKLM